ncbi:hypothetical protein B046DRAFT_00114 [Streptomyces sp. LamerLS-316]|uniref:hypothetical protein n=1 Tax=unclassified Streptomyces TaxID=2593676 RepID=UPI000823EE78|nr:MULTISPECIES: hypothetical protein [unclassified Streptomyces]MYQ40782.1 hypothetical protein [Streptomyces sp. SID4921]SCK05424.1 hypothetical protein B046DRAFT_00114 [Streptomyces sp. LamerLS-316]
MTPRKSRTTAALACAVLAGSGLLAGCQNGNDAKSPSAASASARPHGYVEGAEEASEQQSRLVLADAGTGAVEVLDLITGNTTSLKHSDGVRGLRTDGRFAYLSTDGGTRVVDTGAWTVDHGDHVHYYRAPIRDVGAVAGAVSPRVHSDQAVTAVSSAKGDARLLDRKKLEDGTVPRGTELAGTGSAVVVPYKERLLVTAAGAGKDGVEVRDRDGAGVATLKEPCAQARGEAVTRRGVVFGCADGALLVSEDKGTFEAEKIPYGTAVEASERPAEFHHRAGSTTLAARSGDDAVWVLDVTARSWTRVNTGPVVAANTAGEGAPLLVLGKDGALTAYDITTRKSIARKALLPEGAESAAVEIDTTRAYVNDAAGRKVYEIDYSDRLRLARTFRLGLSPTYMVEAGR